LTLSADPDGDRIRAERHARELVADMHWRGMLVPGLYARMAEEFQTLIQSGDYAAWVATGGSRATRAVRHLPAGSGPSVAGPQAPGF
jgi:hypothetical protein